MPLQKRLPKFGLAHVCAAVTAEIRLSELDKVEGGIITIDSLRAAGLINNSILRAKVFLWCSNHSGYSSGVGRY